MKKILVPTDFSPTAEKAFRFAVDIATKAKSTVILYHTFIPGEGTFIGTEKIRKQYNNIVKRLQRLKKKVVENRTEIPVSTVVGRSPLIDNILVFAEQNHIDLIVMGTHGASGLKKTIIGSVAAWVMEKSHLPVLLIPSKYEIEEVRKIVFATSYQKSDKQALTFVDIIAKLCNADITVLHFLSVYTEKQEKERKDFDTYALSLQKVFNGSKIKFQVLETSSVLETMATLDKGFPYDIMAMVRRKRSILQKYFMKSFTRNMAYITKKPLLIVPEEGQGKYKAE